jgi:hypothetical protein
MHLDDPLFHRASQVQYLTFCSIYLSLTRLLRGGAVVEALRYKPEGRAIDSRWCHMALESTQPITDMSTRNISWG